MHQSMLDGYMNQLLRCARRDLIDFIPHPLDVSLHFRNRRPVRWLILWEPSRRRVDAESEQAIKFRLERTRVECVPAEQVPVEGLHVAHIENNAMTLGDRTLVQRIR